MCAIRGDTGGGGDTVIDMGPMLYRRHGPCGIAEVPPDQCPAGHRLVDPNVNVSWDGTGRTYTCWTCYQAGTRPYTMRYTCGPQ